MNQRKWMAVSGACGLLFFLVANCTTLFQGSRIAAGFAQIAVNTFVFITWKGAFLKTQGLEKFVAFWGVLVPVVMAGITLSRALIPWLLH